MINFIIALFSQGHLRRHCQDLLLPDPGPVEGDPLPEVAIPGVLRLPAEEPSPCRHPEAGGQAVLRRTRGWRCKTDENPDVENTAATFHSGWWSNLI